MKKRLLLFLVCFLTLPVLFAKEAENFYFSNLNLKDGLSQISVLKIMQDSKGFIWCATRNGLNRYDGNRFVAYKHSNTTRIRDFTTCKAGTIIRIGVDSLAWMTPGCCQCRPRCSLIRISISTATIIRSCERMRRETYGKVSLTLHR